MSKKRLVTCPVCDQTVTQDELQKHVNEHFSDKPEDHTSQCSGMYVIFSTVLRSH